VHNDFISSFKRLIYGSSTSRLSLEVAYFLVGKESFEAMENFSTIRLYCSHEKPSFLPYYISDRLFIVEVCKQYKFWAHFFNEKRKIQFIPSPWKIREITMKSISHLDETSTQFDLFNLDQANEIKGFNHNQLLITHMTSIGYSVPFSKTFLFGEDEGDSQNPQGLPVEKLQEDIETTVSTNDHHEHQGRVANERSS
jgi:hypothetical protein